MRSETGLLSYNRSGTARGILIAVCDEAVKAGRLSSHRLIGINLAYSDVVTERKDFAFPTHKEISLMAADCSIVIWLMRGCGLRVREALAISREDFRDGGTMLRVSGQASEDGTRKVPLKHRKAGEFRNVPAPAYLWAMVDDLLDGPVCRGAKPGAIYATHNVTYRQFVKTAKRIGLPVGFTPHSLRHAFASAVPTWCRSPTLPSGSATARSARPYKTYSHLLPSAAGKAKAVLDQEYQEWQQAS